jgi:hypothetical protein
MACQFIYKCLCCPCFCIGKTAQDTHTIFFKNIGLYFNPVELKLLYNAKNNTFSIPLTKKQLLDETNYCYLYKIHKINKKYCKIYNYGYYYHVANLDWTHDSNNYCEIAYPPDTIEYLILQMRSINNEKIYYLEIKDSLIINKNEKFIGSVLSFSTKQTTLNVLLYYYLQHMIQNNDIIVEVKIKFELENDEKIINFMDTLENIYSQFE